MDKNCSYSFCEVVSLTELVILLVSWNVFCWSELFWGTTKLAEHPLLFRVITKQVSRNVSWCAFCQKPYLLIHYVKVLISLQFDAAVQAPCPFSPWSDATGTVPLEQEPEVVFTDAKSRTINPRLYQRRQFQFCPDFLRQYSQRPSPGSTIPDF